MTSLADFSATSLTGEEVDLARYDGQVTLVVNTASECGFTPQYEGLEQLWRSYRDQGLVVLGFPCNQFGGQEPGDEEEIAQFCTARFGVTFPLFAKVDVNGPDAHPLWAWLTSGPDGVPAGDVEWNFTKFLIGADGRVVGRYRSRTEPAELAEVIEEELARAGGTTREPQTAGG
jgi:glutathione peroxidase